MADCIGESSSTLCCLCIDHVSVGSSSSSSSSSLFRAIAFYNVEERKAEAVAKGCFWGNNPIRFHVFPAGASFNYFEFMFVRRKKSFEILAEIVI